LQLRRRGKFCWLQADQSARVVRLPSVDILEVDQDGAIGETRRPSLMFVPFWNGLPQIGFGWLPKAAAEIQGAG
jgi:hypothetical protein